MSTTFMLGVELMLYGLVGVFVTLIVFIGTIYALTKAFPDKGEENQD